MASSTGVSPGSPTRTTLQDSSSESTARLHAGDGSGSRCVTQADGAASVRSIGGCDSDPRVAATGLADASTADGQSFDFSASRPGRQLRRALHRAGPARIGMLRPAACSQTSRMRRPQCGRWLLPAGPLWEALRRGAKETAAPNRAAKLTPSPRLHLNTKSPRAVIHSPALTSNPSTAHAPRQTPPL